MNHEKHFHAAKNLVYLMIVLIAGWIVKIFYEYQFVIMKANTFNLFFILATLGAVLLVSLLYLVSQSSVPKSKAAPRSSSKSKKKKSR